jgi:dihydrofolate reductase
MRKVIFLMHTSLDGMVEGPKGAMDIGWIYYSDELEKVAHSLHASTDAAIYGRVTFQMMEGYFPTLLDQPEDSADGDVRHGHWLDKATKYVFSKSVDSFNWRNTVVIHDNMAEEIQRIKEQPGKDLWLIGSPTVAQEFMRLGLIDEYILTVSPVVLGGGRPLFTNLDKELKLKLLSAQTLENGVVILRYEPDTATPEA